MAIGQLDTYSVEHCWEHVMQNSKRGKESSEYGRQRTRIKERIGQKKIPMWTQQAKYIIGNNSENRYFLHAHTRPS